MGSTVAAGLQNAWSPLGGALGHIFNKDAPAPDASGVDINQNVTPDSALLAVPPGPSTLQKNLGRAAQAAQPIAAALQDYDKQRAQLARGGRGGNSDIPQATLPQGFGQPGQMQIPDWAKQSNAFYGGGGQ